MKVYEMRLPDGWYPHKSVSCVADIKEMIKDFNPEGHFRNAGIVPHAGWYFSGKLAAKVIYTLSKNNPNPDVVCLLGGHLAHYHPVLYYSFETAKTPLGDIEFNQELTKELTASLEKSMEAPDDGDNTIEINLPFIKYFFPNTKIIAFRVPPSDLAIDFGEKLFQIISEKNLNAVVIGSADLTHYGPNYGFMPQGKGEDALNWVKNENDRKIVDAALQIEPQKIIEQSLLNQSSCSGGAIASTLNFIKSMGLNQAKLIDYYTSYEIHPSSSFVGYMGIVF